MKTCVPLALAERRDDIVLVEARASMKSSVCIDETETRGKIFHKSDDETRGERHAKGGGAAKGANVYIAV